MPGISDGFVQQGITYSDGTFLSCGYMSGHAPSRIYLTENGESRYIVLHNENDEEYFGHAGGLSAYGKYVYLCDSEKQRMLVYETATLKTAEAGSTVAAIGAFGVGTNASFCHIDGDTLFVGEFYYAPFFPTNEKHHMTTPSGDEHHALVLAYPLDPEAELGLGDAEPIAAYSVPDKAQGMCTTPNGRFVISTSYAVASSHNYFYALPAEAPSTFEIAEGKSVPLWFMDGGTLNEDVSQPPMSEEIVCVDGRIYVIGESASNKYFFGKLLRSKFVWSYAVD